LSFQYELTTLDTLSYGVNVRAWKGVNAADVLSGRHNMQDDVLEQKSQLEIMHLADLKHSWQ